MAGPYQTIYVFFYSKVEIFRSVSEYLNMDPVPEESEFSTPEPPEPEYGSKESSKDEEEEFDDPEIIEVAKKIALKHHILTLLRTPSPEEQLPEFLN